MTHVYSCRLCKDREKEFTTPVDPIGAAIMKEHLEKEHNFRQEELDAQYRWPSNKSE